MLNILNYLYAVVRFPGKYHPLIILICFFSECGSVADNSERIRQLALEEAGRYSVSRLNSTSSDTSENGIVRYGDDAHRIIVDPSRLFTGYVDEDDLNDAVITIIGAENGMLGKIEHLVFLNTGSGLSLAATQESDMRILSLENRVITAELPTHPRTSPLYNCDQCIEIVKYSFRNGKLEKVE
jgi:hypothetical protein